MIDVSFVNISANDDKTTTTTAVHWVKILAEFQANFGMWVIIGKFDNFGQLLSF